jgi:hypothetical protein
MTLTLYFLVITDPSVIPDKAHCGYGSQPGYTAFILLFKKFFLRQSLTIVAHAGLQSMILLPQSPEDWDCTNISKIVLLITTPWIYL